jgi:hypothetical protein
MLELEPTEKEWLRLYSQGREADAERISARAPNA